MTLASVSATPHVTRDLVDYHFTSIQEIEEAIDAGGFLEHAKVHGNYYGTSKAAVADVQRDGRICILDIDVQGVQQVQDQHFEVSKYIFIEPPSVEDLEHRLRKRGTETEKRIRKRVGAAAGEIEASKSLHWDARIVNNTIEEAYAELRAATEEERERAAIARGLTVATELQGLPRA
ncbi:guk1 [Symbiodinium sp. KB8]|nr:guk1 [Symbiodinium sp. KB8]